MTVGINNKTAFAIFERVADRWNLSPEERCSILHVTETGYEGWKKHSEHVQLSREQLGVISGVANIYDGLHRVFGDEQYADQWIRRDNAAFDGKPPLNALRQSSAGFQRVFDYVMSTAANL